MFDDNYWMTQALREAEQALERNEVPVGCVIVKDRKIIGRGHNQRELLADATAHAEMLAISAACQAVGDWRLEGASLFVTMEPCPMCAGAMVLSRIQRLAFGVSDPKAGACGSLYNIVQDLRLNHFVQVSTGLLQAECRALLDLFFKRLREGKGETV